MSVSRRKFLCAGASAAALSLAACDQIASIKLPWDKIDVGPYESPGSSELDLISHVLNRTSFGPRPGDYARARRIGVEAFIEEQLAPEKIDDSIAAGAVRRFETLNSPVGELYEYKERFLLQEMTRATFLRAAYSRRQLYEVMVNFWTDHFNIDSSKADCKWLKAADDRDVIRAHALGKFPELLRASALSPAMLWYLDGRANRKASAGERPNENYARELMELHTLGINGGYTQQDVMEVARCLTGWTVREGSHVTMKTMVEVSSKEEGKGTVRFDPKMHDDGEKLVLGEKIPAGGGEKDLDRVLDIVTHHPSTARFIAKKLCRRFIAEKPPETAIAAVAETFTKTEGDIPEILRTLFGTTEFREARGTKLKRPFEYIVSAVRATGAETEAPPQLLDYLLRMGHSPFQYPTPDGYPQEASPWMGTLLWRWHFAVALAGNKITKTKVNQARLALTFGGGPSVMAHLLGRRPTTREIESYAASGEGLALMLASPGFQRC